MAKADIVRGYRVIVALGTLFAMIYQFFHGNNDDSGFKTLNFFSFFTIQSNILVIVVLLIMGLTAMGEHPTPRFEMFRGAVVAYIALVGVVYGVLLSGYQNDLQTSLPWVNTILHKVTPIVLVVDWFIVPPSHKIEFRRALKWMIYPLVYLAYTLIRGPQVDWWPYPFLNPHHESQGYGIVTLYCIGIAIGFILFIWLTTFFSRRAPD